MEINPPNNLIENISSFCLRLLIKLVFKKLIRPPQSVKTQRFILGMITPLLFGIKGIKREFMSLKDFSVEILNPPNLTGPLSWHQSNKRVLLRIEYFEQKLKGS